MPRAKAAQRVAARKVAPLSALLSPARAAASRRNGAKSRGPRTAEGKARAAQNALKHGLRSDRFVVLCDEDPDAFEALEAALTADLAPQGVLQAAAAQAAAERTPDHASLRQPDEPEARAGAGASRTDAGATPPSAVPGPTSPSPKSAPALARPAARTAAHTTTPGDRAAAPSDMPIEPDRRGNAGETAGFDARGPCPEAWQSVL